MHHAEWLYRAGPNGACCAVTREARSRRLHQRSVDTVANPTRWANGETDLRLRPGRYVMKRLLFSVAASLLLVLALVGPVGAVGPGCSDFGAASAAGGHREMAGFEGVPFGQVVSLVAHGGLAPAFDNVSQLVQFEHGLYCTHP
jgi:hypothetical protein